MQSSRLGCLVVAAVLAQTQHHRLLVVELLVVERYQLSTTQVSTRAPIVHPQPCVDEDGGCWSCEGSDGNCYAYLCGSICQSNPCDAADVEHNSTKGRPAWKANTTKAVTAMAGGGSCPDPTPSSSGCGTSGCGTVPTVNNPSETCTNCGPQPCVDVDGGCWSCEGSDGNCYAYLCGSTCQPTPCDSADVELNSTKGRPARKANTAVMAVTV